MNAVPQPAACFHCGLPVPPGSRWDAHIGGAVRPMCCPGCAAAAQAIADGGLADYYSTRTEYAPRADDAGADAPELALYDQDPDVGDGVFSVEGIRCAACVWLIERRLERLPGVREAALNVATERLRVSWEPGQCRPSDIVRTLRAIGYGAFPYDAQQHGEQLDRARKKLFRQLFIAGLAMMQVMMYAFPVYIATDGTMDDHMRALMHWASLALTVPAVLYSAQPFFRGAWADLKRGMPGMDVPVALGIGAAFIGSVASLLRGTGEVYFDSITMFIFLLLASRYYELGARRKAARGLEGLQRALPAASQRMPGYPSSRATELVAVAALRPGDHVLVAPGQAVPADGVIVEGATEADLSLLTGETRTQRRAVGDELPGGAVNAAQAVILRVTAASRDSTLALLVRLVERAGQGKPALALWADRIAAWFVAGLLVLTVAVFLAWHVIDPSRAWSAAIAVLVVSCPCALSLATPTALAAATDRLLRRGALAVQPHVLETLARATHIVFDKTGTLTMGRPQLRAATALDGVDEQECLRIAAALEAANEHPIALALRAAAPVHAVAHDLRYVVGEGIEGVVDGIKYRLGSEHFVTAVAGSTVVPAQAGTHRPRDGMLSMGPRLRGDDGVSCVWLGSQCGWLARFELADSARPEAHDIIGRFKEAGKTVVLLSGDEPQAVQAIARELGIDEALGGQLPQDKLDYVRKLQAQGAVVAMVGDGINDAAVLRGADVSFAMGGGAALAQLNADCVLLGDGLAPLADAADTALRTLKVIRQNLGWATVYNLAAIPAAAFGLLNPWLSGVGMAASSALVVANALRLRKGN
ncbi:heavy metal translocating P-type ATPase [Massilia terrae]|uniref:Heavy metal translocating P-type ATPase n=1 Tax=Massilia terrae TaxID=1811224 RepID=A0ABT2CSF5_9BURK|nr:heavy metal translocating P-type ATPase [Massilia terrae]MCS0656902.1 heavy metal translocating P-type ATPase [Massilia terrae]